jgi:putative heme iron utilization protein
MKPDNAFDARLAAKKLLREGRSGALASLMPRSGDPYCSLVNVATAIDGAPLFLLSNLALHTKNILADARVSLMLDERKDGDPLEGARVMLMGSCAKTDPAVAGAYLRRHLEAEMFANFGDFAFYRMEIGRAHLVAGFGRIVDVGPKDLLADMSDAQALVESETGAIAHMNEDHADACRLFATKLL